MSNYHFRLPVAFHGKRCFLRMSAYLILWPVLLFATPAPAHPVVELGEVEQPLNLRPYIQVFEDASGVLTLEDIQTGNPEFSAVEGYGDNINFGYSGSAYWLRVVLNTAGYRAGDEWFLETGFSTLDSVMLYVPDAQGGWLEFSTGDRLPFSERPLAHRNFVFPLVLPAGQTVPVYLRVASEGSLTVPVTLWRGHAFYNHSQNIYAAFSVYYGMLLALGLYNFLLFISLRDKTFLAYVAFVTCMAIGQLSLNGMGNQYFWPDWPAWGNAAFNSGFAATGFFGAIFTRLFLSTRQTVPKLDRIIILLAAGFAFSALAPGFMSYRWAAIITSLLGVSFSAIAVLAGVVCLQRKHPGARWFLLAWTLLLIGVAVMGMRNLGWIPTTTLTTYAMQIGSALEMLLLSFALADRIHIARYEKEMAQAEALKTKEMMVEHLRESEHMLEERVEARTQELAEANAMLRKNEMHLLHLANHDQLTGLANRRLFDKYLNHALALARRHNWQLAILLIDLDGFKQINDIHGHAAGDELLCIVAQRLQEKSREADTVARLGGDEFVVVLEQIRDAAEAENKAEFLGRLLSEPYVTSEGTLKITASVGLAFSPEHGDNPQALLKHADQSMYKVKTSKSVN